MPLAGAIPSRNFELVRDRIAEILAVELPSQAGLHSNADINADVYTSRIAPFDHTDCPCVNVYFKTGTFPSAHENKTDGSYIYHIDVFTKAKSTDAKEGGTKSSEIGTKIAGIIQGVLSDPMYRTLLFAMPSLKRTEVFKIDNPEYLEMEAVNWRLSRVFFRVDTIETVQFVTPTAFGANETTVCINGTTRVLKYEIPQQDLS